MTSGPLITEFWQLALVVAGVIGVIVLLHRIIRRKVGRNEHSGN